MTIKFLLPVDLDSLDEKQQELEKSYEYAKYDYTFDTFIVGSSNEFAYAARPAVAKGGGMVYNPSLYTVRRDWAKPTLSLLRQMK